MAQPSAVCPGCGREVFLGSSRIGTPPRVVRFYRRHTRNIMGSTRCPASQSRVTTHVNLPTSGSGYGANE